jgi:CheY-like chemotaxis protein
MTFSHKVLAYAFLSLLHTPDGMSSRIVLIDDDPEDIEIMLEVLKEMNVSSGTLTFTDPCYAVEVLKDMSPALLPNYIILDIFMPTLNGLECLRQLRALKNLDNASILVHSTAEPTRSIVEEFKQLGVTVYLKPAAFSDFATYFQKFLKSTE